MATSMIRDARRLRPNSGRTIPPRTAQRTHWPRYAVRVFTPGRYRRPACVERLERYAHTKDDCGGPPIPQPPPHRTGRPTTTFEARHARPGPGWIRLAANIRSQQSTDAHT